jgi:hypothetical protein
MGDWVVKSLDKSHERGEKAFPVSYEAKETERCASPPFYSLTS